MHKKVMTQKQSKHLFTLLVIAVILFVSGLAAPMMTISKFIYIRNSFSVLSGTYELLKQGHLVLFLLVSGFSIVLPLLKLLLLLAIIRTRSGNSASMRKYLCWLHDYGRWAMLDVLVVAVLVVAVKLRAIASVEVHAGLYLFGASALLTMFITHRVIHLTS